MPGNSLAIDARASAATATRARPRPRVLQARAASAAVAVVLTAYAIIAVGASAGSTFLVPATRYHPAPGWLAGPLRALGLPSLATPELALLTLGALGAYLLLAVTEWQLPARPALLAVVGVYALVVLGPPLLSGDLISYVSQARIGAVHGLNPYVHGPDLIAGDAAHPYLLHRTGTSPYGPVFTLLTYALAPLGVAGLVWGLKALALAAALGILALTHRLAGQRGIDPLRATLFVALNPLFVLFALGGAHNDLLALAPALAGLLALTARREARAGAALVLATAVKASAGLLLPLALAATPTRRRLTGALAVVAAALAALTLAVFGPWGSGVHALLADGQGVLRTSVAGSAAIGLTGEPNVPSGVRIALDGAFLAAFAYLLTRVRAGMDLARAAGWAWLAFLITTTYLLPWYPAWLLPLAAIGSDRRLRTATLVLTAFVVLSRMPA